MKQISLMLGLASLVGLGAAMAMTNPDSSAYEKYAIDQATKQFKENICQKTQPVPLMGDLLQQQCITLVESSRPQMRNLISASTQRQDYFFFSIYQTRIVIASFIPSYSFTTIGAFQSFYTYQVGGQ
jgi:hypothetical protein